jgi:hypothetical protein
MNRNALVKKFSISIGLFLIMVFVSGSTGCAVLKIKASVAGYVYMNEKLMPNFEVQLINTGNNVVASGKTNQQGHFMITDVPPGEYTVRVLTFSGTPHPKTIQITVRPGRTETFDIDLGGTRIPEAKPGM